MNTEPDKFYYIKLITGEEIITQLFCTEKNKKKHYVLHRPMIIRLIQQPNGDKAIVAVPMVDPTFTADFDYELNFDTVLIFSDKVSENITEVYNGFLDYIDRILSSGEGQDIETFFDDEEPDDEYFDDPDEHHSSRTIH